MREALKQARLAYQADEVPVGAVVVAANGGVTKVIARGHNQVEQLKDPTAHAEMLALTAAGNAIGGKWLPDCTLYVTLEPCVMCAGALQWARIGRVVYGASDEKFGYTRHGNLLHPKTVVTAGILAPECAVLLKEFFQSKR
jgi:tRNA(adenine34) deaminase